MKSVLFILLTIMSLTACQLIETKKEDPCPLTPIDTRDQQASCGRMKIEKNSCQDPRRAQWLSNKMKEMNCELFF